MLPTEHRDLMILIGNEQDLARAVRMGAQGAISGMANFIPTILRGLAEDGKDDDRVGAFMRGFEGLPVTPAVKALTSAHTGDRNWLRTQPPLQSLSEPEIERLANLYTTILGADAGTSLARG